MADLHTATIIADVDLLDTVEFPVRKSAATGLLRGTFAKLKTYLKAGLKMTDFSDVDITTPPTDGQALLWNATASKFKPGAAGGGGGGGSGVASDAARAYLAAATNTVSGAWTKIALDTTSYDTNSIWNAANKRFIPKKAGYYQVSGRLRTTTSGTLTLAIGKNGAQDHALANDATADFAAMGSTLIYCNGTTDYLELFYFAGSVRAISTGSFDTFLEVVGPISTAASTPPSVVQSKSAVGNSGSVTLAAAPTPGNLLVCVGTHWANGLTPTVGWQQVLSSNGASTDGTIICTKVATADDVAALTPYGAVAGACLTVFEVANWDGAIFLPFNYKQETAGTAVTVNFGIPRTGCLLVGHVATISANTAPTSITNAGVVGTTVQGTTTNASPRQATPFYNANATAGGLAITANYAVSASQYIAGLVISPA